MNNKLFLEKQHELVFTKHSTDRMRQRKISNKAIDLIYHLGDWNKSGDKIQLSSKVIDKEIQKKRAEIYQLESLQRRGGGTIIADSNVLITLYTNTKRLLR